MPVSSLAANRVRACGCMGQCCRATLMEVTSLLRPSLSLPPCPPILVRVRVLPAVGGRRLLCLLRPSAKPPARPSALIFKT